MKRSIKSFLGRPVRFLRGGQDPKPAPTIDEVLVRQEQIAANLDPLVLAAGRTMLRAEANGETFGRPLAARLIFSDLSEKD